MREAKSLGVRASTPRSKTGCATCRQRRVKCGEERPGCLRCSKLGFSCPGYQTISNTNQSTEHTSLDLLDVSAYRLPFRVPGTPTERKAIHYFLNYAALDISGWLAIGFWDRTVMQVCESESVVRNAVTALSQAHLERVSAKHDDGVSTQSLAAYMKASKALRVYMYRQSQPSRLVVLICCLIFHTIEGIRGYWQDADRHLDCGLSIIRSWRNELRNEETTSLTGQEDLEELLEIFARCDHNATRRDSTRTTQLDSLDIVPSKSIAVQESTAIKFHGVRDLINQYTRLVTAMYQLLTRHLAKPIVDAEKLLNEKRAFAKRYRDFGDALDSFVLEDGADTDVAGRGSSVLERQSARISLLIVKFQYQSGRGLIEERFGDGGDSATNWEQIAPRFLATAEEIITEREAIKPLLDVEEFGSFSPEHGIIGGLALLAHRTKSPEIRRQAVALGRRVKWREGLHEVFIDFAAWLDKPEPKADYVWFRGTGHK